MSTGPPNESAPVGAGARERTEQEFRSPIVRFPRVDCKRRDGLVGLYRRPRPHGEAIRAIATALRRETHISRVRRVPVPNQVLLDIADWADRGCLPA